MFRSRLLPAIAFLLLPAMLLTAAPPARKTAKPASADAILPFKASEKTLPNGLKVIVVPTGFPNIVSVQIPVQTGSRNEIEAGKSGFAHFFEHIMFRGTETYSPEKYGAIIQKAGARQNAYTTDDYTNYHTTFAKEDLPEILKIEADRFRNLSYPADVFKTEARAVLGEYNKNAANPIRKLLEAQRDAAFTTHTYKHTTMGFIKDIEDMPNQYAYSKEFFQRWYRPGNVTIIVAGDVQPASVFSLVEKYWGDWKPGSYKAAIPAEPASAKPVYTHVEWPTQTLPWVTVAFRTPGFSDSTRDTAALDTMLDLEFGETSAIHKRLVEQEQKVDRLFVYNDPHVDPLLSTVFARVKNPADTVMVRDEILRTFARLRDQPEPAARVDEAKSNSRYAFVRSLDNTEAIAATLAEYVRFHRSYGTIDNYYRQLAGVTPADIQAFARKHFTDNNLVVTTLSNGPLPAPLATLPALQSLGAPAATATGSDLRMITQKSVLPQLEIKLLFNARSTSDPEGHEGLALLAAQMVADAGSKEMRIDEINKALYPMAGAFSTQVDKDMTTFTASIHRDNWPKFLDIVLPQLLSPGFREEDFQRIRDMQLNSLEQDLRSNNEEELKRAAHQQPLRRHPTRAFGPRHDRRDQGDHIV